MTLLRNMTIRAGLIWALALIELLFLGISVQHG